jgi:hypothetical protein
MAFNSPRSPKVGQTAVIDIVILLPIEFKCIIITFIPLKITVIFAERYSSQRQSYTG